MGQPGGAAVFPTSIIASPPPPLVDPREFRRIQACLRLRPEHPQLWAQLLHLHWANDQPFEGLRAWRQACRHLSQAQRPHLLHGNLLRDLNRFEAADIAYRRARALAVAEDSHAVGWNHSQLLIGLERYSQAYALAEERLLLPHHQAWRPGPYWQGWCPDAAAAPAARSDRDAACLTIWTEQGIGDGLQYLRWIPRLLQRGWRLRLEVEPPLLPLLREGLAWLGPALSVQVKGLAPRPLPSACQGSLLSLPWLLGEAPLASLFKAPEASAASREVVGYLRSPLWPAPPPAAGRRPRIGLVWASGRKQDDAFIRREYQRRSLPAEVLVALLEGLAGADADLVCLQYGPDRQRAAGWRGSFAATLSDGISLAETARWIAGLDLVITVDTAMAHLVGAMARPGWVLLPWAADPRWLRAREDSPWYPTLTLLRQPAHGDWPGLLALLLERFRTWRAAWARP